MEGHDRPTGGRASRNEAIDDVTGLAEEELRTRALELNNEVIQNIALAKMSLDLQERERAYAALDRALHAAQEIVSHLLRRRSHPIAAGDLVVTNVDEAATKGQSEG